MKNNIRGTDINEKSLSPGNVIVKVKFEM